MPSSLNFEHLRKHWPQLSELGAYAENYSVSDPQSAMVKLRCYVELMVGQIYKELRLPSLPHSNIYDNLTSGSFTTIVDQIILDKFHAIRRGGNKVAHEGD
jgi:type I restriction enzyme R subunit